MVLKAARALSVKERFWAKVYKTDACWLWIGAKSSGGYGFLKVEGRMQKAARLVYAWEYGPIPAGMSVMHSCDNPPCVKLGHLSLGTPKDNTQDMIAKGRRGVFDYRAVQRRGAATKLRRTMTETLPRVVREVRELMAQDIKPTTRSCQIIPGYNSIKRYVKQGDLIAMAKKEVSCVPYQLGSLGPG